ncbi:sulfite reductase (NADPH) flavoprotein alpha-component [Duganella sp. CF517]|uniref:sulfite reductase subunit alpha n=1 Tax=Duganella sp. CF517 TaxID=1881038 RepID=UPI0008B9BBBB|nr:sulfite reductase subunit alpha [Duganella sp. CF517]SEN34545.1 sulfite reductase (NADPH) flavoprotein alpha-component [Duganella sp. CF517]
MIWTDDPTRLMLVAALGAGYGLACLLPYLRHRRKRQAALRAKAEAAAAPGWIVAYASQTGNAEALAQQTLATLRLAGIAAQLSELSELDADDLRRAERILFLVSTYGEGDAPDAAAAFAGRLMTTELPLAHLHYAVLALGDSAYARFCGFGRALDAWLAARGAHSLFPRIEVDRSADAAVALWRQQLSHLAGTSDAPDWSAPAFADWTLRARTELNSGSAGAPLYHLELAPPGGVLPDWQSGDLVQIAAPAEPSRPREYSIASIPADGAVQLLVRLHSHDDGSHGVASGWLTRQAEPGGTVRLRLRQHRRFRLEDNARRPLILIGNGSGIAGLRGHLRARALAGQGRNWLLFGERNSAHDFHYRDELEALHRAGRLELDLAWSRDGGAARYVQDLLPARADKLRAWVDDGAAIYVCGSLEGMAAGVDQALETILGSVRLAGLAAEKRYQRDVY